MKGRGTIRDTTESAPGEAGEATRHRVGSQEGLLLTTLGTLALQRGSESVSAAAGTAALALLAAGHVPSRRAIAKLIPGLTEGLKYVRTRTGLHIGDADTLQIPDDLGTDIARFALACSQGDFTSVAETYKGAFLQDYGPADDLPLSAVVAPLRDQFEQQYLVALKSHVRHLLQRGAPTAALTILNGAPVRDAGALTALRAMCEFGAGQWGAARGSIQLHRAWCEERGRRFEKDLRPVRAYLDSVTTVTTPLPDLEAEDADVHAELVGELGSGGNGRPARDIDRLPPDAATMFARVARLHGARVWSLPDDATGLVALGRVLTEAPNAVAASPEAYRRLRHGDPEASESDGVASYVSSVADVLRAVADEAPVVLVALRDELPLRDVAALRLLASEERLTRVIVLVAGEKTGSPLQDALPIARTSTGSRTPAAVRRMGALLSLAAAGTLWWAARPLPVALGSYQGTSPTGLLIRRARWSDSPRIELMDSAALSFMQFAGPEGSIEPSIRGNAWLVERDVLGRGTVTEVFESNGTHHVIEEGNRTRATWSNDGRHIVFATDREDGSGLPDIASYDLATRAVQFLVRDSTAKHFPVLDPSGRRVAFVRPPVGGVAPSSLCVTHDAQVRCLPTPHEETHLLDWLSDSTVLLAGGPLHDQRVGRFHIGNGAWEPLIEAHGQWTYARSEGVLLCRCIVRGGTKLLVLRSVRDHFAPRAIDFGASPGIVGTATRVLPRRSVPPMTASPLREVLPADLSEGTSFLLPGLSAWVASSSNARVLQVRGDTIFATAEGTTTILLRRPRPDSVRVRVKRVLPGVVEYPWNPEGFRGTTAFGDPRARVVSHQGAPALLIDGDGSFETGFYVDHPVIAQKAPGIEAVVSVPVTETKWQLVRVAIGAMDEARLARWDHIGGALPWEDPTGAHCEFAYPAGEAANSTNYAILAAGTELKQLPIGLRLGTGRKFVVRLQVLTDGRCDFHVDGIRWTSASRMPRDAALRLVVRGNSHRTSVLTHALRTWEGERAPASK